MLEFKGKKIMLDCGIHPGLSGMDALPYVDLIEADEIDLLFISQCVLSWHLIISNVYRRSFCMTASTWITVAPCPGS